MRNQLPRHMVTFYDFFQLCRTIHKLGRAFLRMPFRIYLHKVLGITIPFAR